MSIVKIASTGQPQDVYIMPGIFSLDTLYLAGKTLLLNRDILAIFGDILIQSSKSSAILDMV